MTLTLSIDERLVAEARRLAEALGTNLDRMVQDYLADLVQATNPDEFGRRLRALTAEGRGRSGGERYDRNELHERADVP